MVTRWRHRAVGCTQRCAVFAGVIALAGCVTAYQPMSGLHRPIAINPAYANFADVSITLRCRAEAAEEVEGADVLCQKVRRLFENQGAQVRIAGSGEAEEAVGEAPPPRAALTIDLEARVLHRETTNFIFWTHISDYTFAQEVSIRDETGFLLARETLTGRFIKHFGFT
ncbi:MAG: hypothetical protein KC620_12575, partial [Myxococcales bacterium]|nr:hypothetical protein [Myxococcales bacterium]